MKYLGRIRYQCRCCHWSWRWVIKSNSMPDNLMSLVNFQVNLRNNFYLAEIIQSLSGYTLILHSFFKIHTQTSTSQLLGDGRHCLCCHMMKRTEAKYFSWIQDLSLRRTPSSGDVIMWSCEQCAVTNTRAAHVLIIQSSPWYLWSSHREQ